MSNGRVNTWNLSSLSFFLLSTIDWIASTYPGPILDHQSRLQQLIPLIPSGISTREG